jgi:hypothetical protein
VNGVISVTDIRGELCGELLSRVSPPPNNLIYSSRLIANPVEHNPLSVANYRPNPFSTFSDAQPKDTPDRQSVEV